MALMRTHVSSMKIHVRKLHVLLTKEASSKYVIIYAFLQKTINHRSYGTNFVLQKSFLQKMGKYLNKEIS